MNWSSVWRGLKLTWREHKSIQLATLVVLSATFTVVISILSLGENLRSILKSWGESVQITAYLSDEAGQEEISKIQSALQSIDEFREVKYVSKDEAKDRFSKQMENYAPALVADGAFENPFPASFEIALRNQEDLTLVESLANRVEGLKGVEDVSFGQEWLGNYAALVRALRWAGWSVGIILALGSLLVVSNSIRASLDRRREEIQILRLVGATARAIRIPFVVEGAFLGALATAVALVLSYGIFRWQWVLLHENLAFSNVAGRLHFLSPVAVLLVGVGGIAVGSIGSYLCVYKLTTDTAGQKDGPA